MIREAVKKDIPRLMEMGSKFTSKNGYDIPTDAETVEKLMSDLINADQSEAVLLVSEHEGQIVGMLAGIISPIYYNSNVTRAQELWWWVEEDKRNLKAGIELFTAYEEWAKHYKVHHIVCSSLDDKVNKWYNRKGYTLKEYCLVKEINGC